MFCLLSLEKTEEPSDQQMNASTRKTTGSDEMEFKTAFYSLS